MWRCELKEQDAPTSPNYCTKKKDVLLNRMSRPTWPACFTRRFNKDNGLLSFLISRRRPAFPTRNHQAGLREAHDNVEGT